MALLDRVAAGAEGTRVVLPQPPPPQLDDLDYHLECLSTDVMESYAFLRDRITSANSVLGDLMRYRSESLANATSLLHLAERAGATEEQLRPRRDFIERLEREIEHTRVLADNFNRATRAIDDESRRARTALAARRSIVLREFRGG